MTRKILVTGGAGYIGSILTRDLIDKDYDVIVYDKGLFGFDSIKNIDFSDSLEIIQGDIRNPDLLSSTLTKVDDVIHLAALVGEPACSEDPDETIEVNLQSTVTIKRLCNEYDVNRLIFLSTCSVYGDEDNEPLTETAKTRPISAYSQTKRLAEQSLLDDGDYNFNPVILRLATVYGLSYRPRFDLSINHLTKKAVLQGEGKIYGGDQWRPFIHVNDISRAICNILSSDIRETANQIFNVGGNDENYQMKEIGRILDQIVRDARIEVDPSMVDERSYRCSFNKIQDTIGFKPKLSVHDGIIQMQDALKEGEIKDPNNTSYYNYSPKGGE